MTKDDLALKMAREPIATETISAHGKEALCVAPLAGAAFEVCREALAQGRDSLVLHLRTDWDRSLRVAGCADSVAVGDAPREIGLSTDNIKDTKLFGQCLRGAQAAVHDYCGCLFAIRRFVAGYRSRRAVVPTIAVTALGALCRPALLLGLLVRT